MKLKIDTVIEDEYVRIMDRDLILIAISSKSKSNPGLWINKSVTSMRIVGVDLI
jgi:hypothetical protein